MSDEDHNEPLATVKAAIEDATFDVLVKKPRRSSEFTVTVAADDGAPRQVKLRYRAISGKEYDDLLAAHKPTPKQEARGAVYNADTFAPALIAAVSEVPKLNEAQAKELYQSPEWSSGESGQLFMEAIRVCQSGLDVPFSAGD